jgi:hypothetical protein
MDEMEMKRLEVVIALLQAQLDWTRARLEFAKRTQKVDKLLTTVAIESIHDGKVIVIPGSVTPP